MFIDYSTYIKEKHSETITIYSNYFEKVYSGVKY